MKTILSICLFCMMLNPSRTWAEGEKPYVIANIYNQLGNNFFQVAAASALAWDNGAEPHFPDFDSNSVVYQHVFFRFSNQLPKAPLSFFWEEPIFSYQSIPYQPNMLIHGYYQSEKYFSHHREKLLELFAPHPDDLEYIQNKYQHILSHPNTVGVQLRYYKWEHPHEDLFPQYGKEYLKKTMGLFPKSYLFVISSNNIEYARKCVPSFAKNVIFIENEPHYIDFYILSMCKHNIITNSTFGWWSAWLNQNPKKVVVRPSYWIKGLPTQDVCPDEWISVKSKHH